MSSNKVERHVGDSVLVAATIYVGRLEIEPNIPASPPGEVIGLSIYGRAGAGLKKG